MYIDELIQQIRVLEAVIKERFNISSQEWAKIKGQYSKWKPDEFKSFFLDSQIKLGESNIAQSKRYDVQSEIDDD